MKHACCTYGFHCVVNLCLGFEAQSEERNISPVQVLFIKTNAVLELKALWVESSLSDIGIQCGKCIVYRAIGSRKAAAA